MTVFSIMISANREQLYFCNFPSSRKLVFNFSLIIEVYCGYTNIFEEKSLVSEAIEPVFHFKRTVPKCTKMS